VRRDGERRLYRADHDGLGPFKPFLESLWAQQLDRLAMIELEPSGDGTLVRLTHSDLVAPPIAELHRQGWEHYLDRLRIRAQGGDPGADAVRAEMA
jgi:hypothetical protein